MTPIARLSVVLLMCSPVPGIAQDVPTILERFDFGTRSARADLPGRLDEVSGLAFTPDGRLFAHDDERAWVHEIDPATGEVGKRFMLGERTAHDDPSALAQAHVDDSALRTCLEALAPERREAISLAFFTGMSHRELSAAMGKPAGTVKSWIRRGLSQLRRCLES